jgi:hypothetical protein
MSFLVPPGCHSLLQPRGCGPGVQAQRARLPDSGEGPHRSGLCPRDRRGRHRDVAMPTHNSGPPRSPCQGPRSPHCTSDTARYRTRAARCRSSDWAPGWTAGPAHSAAQLPADREPARRPVWFQHEGPLHLVAHSASRPVLRLPATPLQQAGEASPVRLSLLCHARRPDCAARSAR